MQNLDQPELGRSPNVEHWQYHEVRRARPARRRFPWLSIGAVLGVLVLVLGIGALVWPMIFSPASSSTATGVAANDPFSTFAQSAGATTCAATYAKLGNGLISGSRFTFQTQVADKDPNQHSLQGTIGMSFPQTELFTGQAAGIVLAAPNGAGCEGNSVRVMPTQQSCDVAAGLLPQGSKKLAPLSGLDFYALPTGEQTLLLPVGSNCVAVTTARMP